MRFNFEDLRSYEGQKIYSIHFVDDESDETSFATTADDVFEAIMEYFEVFHDEWDNITFRVHEAVAKHGCFTYDGYFGKFCGNADEFECIMQENEDLHECDYTFAQ